MSFPNASQTVRIIHLELADLERQGFRSSEPCELSDDRTQLLYPINNANADRLVSALAHMGVVATAIPAVGECTRSWVHFATDLSKPGQLTEAIAALDALITSDTVLAAHGALRSALYELQTSFADSRLLRQEVDYRDADPCLDGKIASSSEHDARWGGIAKVIENYSYDSQAAPSAPSRWDQLAAARSHAVRVGGAVVNLHWSTGRGEYTVHADRAAAAAALDSYVGPAVPGSMGEHGTRVHEDYVDLTPDDCSDSYVRIIASPYISTYAGARQGDNLGISATVHVLNTGCAGKREALVLAAAWAGGPEAAHLARKGAGLVRVALESTQYAGEVFCTTGEGRGYVDDPDDLPPGWHMRHGWKQPLGTGGIAVNCYPELVETYDRDEHHLYGLWRLLIDGKTVDVGCVIGVRESDRVTAQKSGAGNRCFLAAWYADSSDWSTHEERDSALEIMTEHVQYLASEHGIA